MQCSLKHTQVHTHTHTHTLSLSLSLQLSASVGEARVPRPEAIHDEEELERLAGLQLRDNLVRGMGVSEQVRVVLESQPGSRAETPAPPPVGTVKGASESNTDVGGGGVFFTQAFLQETPHHHYPPPTLNNHFSPAHTQVHESMAVPGSTTTLRQQLPGYRLQQRRASCPLHSRTHFPSHWNPSPAQFR